MPETLDLYEADFVRWSEEQASALRSAAGTGTDHPLDWDTIEDAHDKARRVVRAGPERYGEWTPEVRRHLDQASFSETQVLGPWLPDVGPERAS